MALSLTSTTSSHASGGRAVGKPKRSRKSRFHLSVFIELAQAISYSTSYAILVCDPEQHLFVDVGPTLWTLVGAGMSYMQSFVQLYKFFLFLRHKADRQFSTVLNKHESVARIRVDPYFKFTIFM
eukprot:CAMPEP_0202086130 /NCGR_PEP_ID=MMETSP0964-20121228/32611_1 /ASSEMBLY_ACC=CAM_ASM_000500 /TAXON_ID=4773 /ORGANISM="Schizochytrium aggregatum, Strain ATCC28209" /LENGTH=124 /DNA_ID=CAMNT_0048654007 /DNA_START=96 /DNA_END=467 /DNA_ORIENTATION=+